jgi:hypothetical protein
VADSIGDTAQESGPDSRSPPKANGFDSKSVPVSFRDDDLAAFSILKAHSSLLRKVREFTIALRPSPPTDRTHRFAASFGWPEAEHGPVGTSLSSFGLR